MNELDGYPPGDDYGSDLVSAMAVVLGALFGMVWAAWVLS